MMRFIEWPWALGLVVLLPTVVFVMLQLERRSRIRRLARLGAKALLARLAPFTARVGGWRTTRLVTAFALLGFAFAGPRWGFERTVNRQNGVDVVLALDASLSMTASDVKPSRLEKMKDVARQLRALSPADRFALIAFAGHSYILTPLTTDDGALNLYLDNLDPTVVGVAGTSLTNTLRQATQLLNIDKGDGDRAIVLMSDGEGFESESDVTSEAKRAADAGIALVAVGFGTLQGATIPGEGGSGGLKRDQFGQIVVTHYTPTLLRAAAEAAGGVFIPAGSPNAAEQIRHVLDGLKTQAHAVAAGRDLSPRFMWFIAPAVLLLLLDTFLSPASAPTCHSYCGGGSARVVRRAGRYQEYTTLQPRHYLTRARLSERRRSTARFC